MSLAGFLRRVVFILLPLALILTPYLYLYPVFHGCAFPAKDGSPSTAFFQTLKQHSGARLNHTQPNEVPVFRLLVLADPQLEGSSSLPDPEDALIPSLLRHWTTVTEPSLRKNERKTRIKAAVRAIFLEDIPRALRGLRKQIDLFGNDYYLGHIYRTLHWWSNPTHVTVLGDLIGSQWVTDDEFAWRSRRYWDRVFRGGEKIDKEYLKEVPKPLILDPTSWKEKIINIVGNHDVGYAGDISRQRMDRFETAFGPANWDVRFFHPEVEGADIQTTPTIHLIVLNDLILDTPALVEEIQTQTYEYMNGVISGQSKPVEDRSSFTLLLTHVPLHKQAGVCVDAPFFSNYHYDDEKGRFKRGGLREQNHLSEHVSINAVLQGIFGMSPDPSAPAQGKGRNGLILTGHDHEGCDTWHHVPKKTQSEGENENESPSWTATRWKSANTSESHTGIREVTLRSMMGDYNGNAGLLSAWFDLKEHEWKYDIQMCRLGTQHLWWAVHIIDFILVVFLILLAFLARPQGQGVKSQKAVNLEPKPTTPKVTSKPANGQSKSNSEKDVPRDEKKDG